MKIWPLWRRMLLARKPPWLPTLCITLKMLMGGTWCTQISLLIMFGKFKKKFGLIDNEKKKLLGKCILYILPLVNASSSTSYLLSYWARPLSNISGCLWSIGITSGRHIMGHVDAGNTYQWRHKKAKESFWLSYYSTLLWIWKCYGKDIKMICHTIRDIDTSQMEALPRMPTMTPYYSSRPN